MQLAPPEAPSLLPPGTRVGPWRLVGLRAQGSYGFVYLAEQAAHPEAGPFALKLARHPLDPRFDNEAELLSLIEHPHVPRLHERGHWVSPQGVSFPYLVLDWVEGLPLYSWAREHPLTSREALRLLAQVARALEATHAAGGVHRDLKGDNILVRAGDTQALLMDYGSCHHRGAPRLTRGQPPPGTPQYWSPECLRFQWRTRHQPSARYEARAADDVYALGMTAYRLVTGSYPPGEKEPELPGDDDALPLPALVPPEALVHLEPELARLIRQMLSDEPSARGSAVELAELLEHAARTTGRRADRLITPRAALTSTAHKVWSERVLLSPTRRRGLIVSAASVALLASAWGAAHWLLQKPTGATRGISQQARDSGTEDEPTAGVAQDALTEHVGVMKPEPARRGISRGIPKEPLPGQRRPPCEIPESEINGGCWVLLGNAAPPCGKRMYEWKNGCYWPSFDSPRPDTTKWP
ncbi:MAG: serine/threonine protein kinase [Myxococcaceae bacterium]|nr:serine/threonine protein kinase [Myxococcaceae bacterium]